MSLITVKMPKVTGLTVAWDRKLPAALHITAVGHVTQVGWRNQRLSPWVYLTEPADGIWDMELIAEVPKIVIGLYKPQDLIAYLEIDPAPRWVKGIRVHASSNVLQSGEDKQSDLAKAVSKIGDQKEAGDPGDAFPWIMQL